MFKNTSRIIIAIFALSMALRVTLAFYNRESNDSHIEVVNWIVDKHELPVKTDCWQCYQLKFFHLIAAGIIEVCHIHDYNARIITVQFLNVLLGFFTLLFFWKYIRKYPTPEPVKLLTFAFFAFNPCLAGINIQGTNDSMEILAGVMIVYYADLVLQEANLKRAAGLTFALILAAMTKTTGLVLFAIVSIAFALKILSLASRQQKWILARYYSGILIVFILVVPVAGGYYDYYKRFNSLPTSAWEKDTPPLLFESTKVYRPGVRNMAEAFFTFRYIDMVRQPYITNESEVYPMHRTSLWSQLYGRTVFMHFDQWPQTWQTHAPFIINVGRVLIIIGIVPLLIFLGGFIKGLFQTAKLFFTKGFPAFAGFNTYIHVMVTLVFLVCSVKYCCDIRDFSAMKSIYIFPGLLSYISLFLMFYASVKSRLLLRIISWVLVTMVVLSVVDMAYLVQQLKA